MKLVDIANKIDRSKENEDWIDITKIGYEFNINLDYIEQDRLKAYWVSNWCCTDTWVGYRMYFLDDEPVAFSIQTARKNDENIKWFGEEKALKVRDYLISLMTKQEEDLNFELCDINEEIGDSYEIQYNANVINWSNAMLNKEDVKFIERIRYEKDYGIDKEVKIQLSNGEEKIVNIHELRFKFHLV
jgi:hypothetical protein